MKNLISVLESMGIHKVVSLDDDYNYEVILERHNNDEIQDIINTGAGKQLSDQERQVIEDSGVTLLSDVQKSKMLSSEIKSKLCQIVIESDTSNISLSILENAFVEQGFEYKKLFGIERIAAENTDEGILWLLDKEVNGRNILPDALKEIMYKEQKMQSDLIVIVTYDDNLFKLTSSWDRRFDYLKDEVHLPRRIADQMAYSLFVVSKTKLMEKQRYNLEAARQYFSESLIHSMDGYCVYNILKIMKEYARQSYRDLLKFAKDSNQRTFEHIHYNMVIENDSNMFYILQNVHNMMQEAYYGERIDEYQKYIFTMRRLSPYPKKKDNALIASAIKNVIKSYRWSKFQFFHTGINSVYSDVIYGDVFKLKVSDKEKHVIGVLITQPCDCVLRNDGNGENTCRKARKFTLALFEECILDIDRSDGREVCLDQKLKDDARKIRNNAVFYAVNRQEDESWRASYIEADSCIDTIQVAPFILDLVSLNIKGTAKLMNDEEIDTIMKKYKTDNWIHYCELFKKEIDDFIKQRELIHTALNENVDDILTSIYGVSFSCEKNEFAIERIGRLEENAMALVRYHYIAHAYRAGKNSLLALYLGDNPEQDDRIC